MRSIEELVRVARRPDGSLTTERTAPGRGAWLCRVADGVSCFELARSRRAFARALRTPIASEAIDDLLEAHQAGAG